MSCICTRNTHNSVCLLRALVLAIEQVSLGFYECQFLLEMHSKGKWKMVTVSVSVSLAHTLPIIERRRTYLWMALSFMIHTLSAFILPRLGIASARFMCSLNWKCIAIQQSHHSKLTKCQLRQSSNIPKTKPKKKGDVWISCEKFYANEPKRNAHVSVTFILFVRLLNHCRSKNLQLYKCTFSRSRIRTKEYFRCVSYIFSSIRYVSTCWATSTNPKDSGWWQTHKKQWILSYVTIAMTCWIISLRFYFAESDNGQADILEREKTYTRRQKCSEITEQFGLNELPLFAIAPTRWQYNNVHPFASTFVSFRLPFLDCNFEFAWVYSFQVCLQPQLDPFLRINDSNVWPERRINVQKMCANERIFALHFDI